MRASPSLGPHQYRVEFLQEQSCQLVECIQFRALDAGRALSKAESFVPQNVAVSMYEDDQPLGTVQLLANGFWTISQTSEYKCISQCSAAIPPTASEAVGPPKTRRGPCSS